MTPEARARVEIDRLPKAASPFACNNRAVSARSAVSATMREFPRIDRHGHPHNLPNPRRNANGAQQPWPP